MCYIWHVLLLPIRLCLGVALPSLPSFFLTPRPRFSQFFLPSLLGLETCYVGYVGEGKMTVGL